MDVQIKELRARAVRVPLPEPHRTASGVVAESPLVLVDVVTNNGVIGHGLVFTYTPAALRPTAELIRNLGAAVEGSALAPAAINQSLARRFRLLGTQGLVGMALAGLDMALWDALARVHQVSLTRLLGGLERRLPCYGAVGFDGEEGSARATARLREQGFRGVKAKIGYPTVAEDLAVVQAIRREAGRDISVMVDYNQSLSPAEASERLRILDDEGLAWVEEPTLSHDFRGNAQVAAAARTPVQCGENWWGVLDMQHALEAGASDYVMPDVMKIGGVTGWLGAAALAHARNVPMSSHLWPEVSAQLLCCTPTAHWLEYVDWWNAILTEPLRLEDGDAIPSEAPGSGITWNEEAVRRFAA